jgi:hypothetical protein
MEINQERGATTTYADVINRASGGKPVTVFVASRIIPVQVKLGRQNENVSLIGSDGVDESHTNTAQKSILITYRSVLL